MRSEKLSKVDHTKFVRYLNKISACIGFLGRSGGKTELGGKKLKFRQSNNTGTKVSVQRSRQDFLTEQQKHVMTFSFKPILTKDLT